MVHPSDRAGSRLDRERGLRDSVDNVSVVIHGEQRRLGSGLAMMFSKTPQMLGQQPLAKADPVMFVTPPA
jgi:hypothetical protein